MGLLVKELMRFGSLLVLVAFPLLTLGDLNGSSRSFLQSIGFYEDPLPEMDVVSLSTSSSSRSPLMNQCKNMSGGHGGGDKRGPQGALHENPDIAKKFPPSRLNCLARINMTIYNITKAANKKDTETPDGGGNETSSGGEKEPENDDDNDDEVIPQFNLDDPVQVRVLNGTSFLSLINYHNAGHMNRSTPGDCFLTLFYSSICPFSTNLAATPFNALARIFPDVQLFAIDSRGQGGLSTLSHYGVMALPTIFIFHNHRPMYKFNGSNYDLKSFTHFVSQFTGMEPVEPVEIMDDDREGPVPTKVKVVYDVYLYLAWGFTILVAVVGFVKSSLCDKIYETILNTWREAEIQRQHQD